MQVLLEAGAPYRVGNYNALEHAVDLRRADLAHLMVQHGARVTEVSMSRVLDTWDSEIAELFLAQGANLHEGKPVAWALIHKVRPVLGLLKRFGPTDPDVMAQAACALRHHAYEGNVKWVSLLLWAGADPGLSGSADPSYDDDCHNALERAVMAGKLDVLRIKKMMATMSAPNRPELARVLEHCRNSEVLELLLAAGHVPEKLHMLVARGAKWLPNDKRAIGYLRKSFLMMTRDYLLEFAWLTHRYRSARRRDVEELFRTPSVARLLGDQLAAAQHMIAQLPDEVA